MSSDRAPLAVILDPSDNGIPLAAALAARSVPVTILATPAFTWVAKTRWAEGAVLPGIGGNETRWIERLGRLEPPQGGVLIPGSDAACEFLVRARTRLPAALRSFEAPGTAHLELMDKASLHEIAARAGVAFPASHNLRTPAELDEVSREVAYPCLMKPVLSHEWRKVFGADRVLVMRDRAAVLQAARPALDLGLELLLTEYIPGPDRNLEGIVVVRRADGTYAMEYGRRKIRQHPPAFGAGTVHESFDPAPLRAPMRRLLDMAGFVGVVALEFKRHADTGERYLLDANVRVPQGWAVAEASGVDASWRLYATLAGLDVPRQAAQTPGVRVVVPTLEVHAIARALTQRRASVRRLLDGYRGVRDISGLSLRDPRPALALARRLAGSAVRHSAAHVWRGGRGGADTGAWPGGAAAPDPEASEGTFVRVP
jgi:predicted ATP-grasp superfamily ATP-dependent carboligase